MISRLIAALLLLGISTASFAETKIIERSAKHLPQWVGSAEDGYLIISVRATSLSAAQDEALQKISEAIIKSVATNINISQSNTLSETVINDKIDSEDSFRKQTSIIAARLPYIQGISLVNASDVYWERKLDKKTKEEFYDYTVKYPYSKSEQNKLIAQYKEIDSRYESALNDLQEGITHINSANEISAALSQLDTLEKFFVDEVRLTRVRTLRTRYKDLYKGVSIYGTLVSDTELVCGLQLNGHRFGVSSIGSVTSSCARVLSQSRTDDNQFIIKFNSEDCLPDDINTISVMFKVGGRRLEQKFELPDTYSSQPCADFAVRPTGTIYLTADSASAADRTVSDIGLRMSIDNKSGLEFGIKSIEIKVPELASDIVLDNLDMIYSTKGIITLTVDIEGTYRIVNTASSVTSFATGVITIVNPSTEALERVRFTLPYITNWRY